MIIIFNESEVNVKFKFGDIKDGWDNGIHPRARQAVYRADLVAVKLDIGPKYKIIKNRFDGKQRDVDLNGLNKMILQLSASRYQQDEKERINE